MVKQSPPLVRQLSEKHRKLVRSILKREGDLSREQFFRRTKKQWSREVDKYSGKTWYAGLLENTKNYHSCTDEEAAAAATASLYGSELLRRGVARRIIHDDPSELGYALSLATRIEWLDRGRPGQRADDKYPDVWTVFHGLAAGDLEVARAYFGDRPRMVSGGHRPTVLIYNTVQAIVTENRRAQARLCPEIEFADVPDCSRAVLRTLYGIIAADATIVAGGLEHVLVTFRRFQFHEEEMIISLIGHGLAELAYWVSPELLAEVDTDRPLPWDREYYKWLRRGNRSTKYRDMSKYSILLHRWIHDLEEPGWWQRRRS